MCLSTWLDVGANAYQWLCLSIAEQFHWKLPAKAGEWRLKACHGRWLSRFWSRKNSPKNADNGADISMNMNEIPIPEINVGGVMF